MSTPVLLALNPAPLASVQDMGRAGWRRFGVTGAGAMDAEALAAANALAGNPVDAAAVEFAHAGGDWVVAGASCRIGITGGSFLASVDGRALAPNTSTLLHPGQTLRIGGAQDAVWGYLAVSGGLQVRREFGSRSTHVRSGLGGLEGRFIRPGDALPLVAGGDLRGGEWSLPVTNSPPDAPIRVMLGPQDAHFTAAAIADFLHSEFRVTWQGDRMGYRLDGPPINHAGSFNIISDGLLPGSIQVPGNGQPIVLLRDAQTTGGYPKIATVISADLGRLAQRRPRSAVRFQQVSRDDAQLLRREFFYRVQATRLRVTAAA